MSPPRASVRRVLVLLPILASGWSLWTVANSAAWMFKAPERAAYLLRYGAVDGAIGLGLCAGLFVAYGRLRRRLELGAFIGVAGLLCFATAMVWHAASAAAMWRLGWSDGLHLNVRNVLVGGGLMDGMTLAMFTVLFFAVDYRLESRDQRAKAAEAAALAQQAQLQMLRYQLNPHFLFNALNSIRAMIRQEPERARQILTELAEFLRYSLNGRGHESTLREELAAIESYLAIQRIRFEEKLAVAWRIDPALEDLVLPCFLVHPLVENAVKYGMETSELPLRLEIEITVRGGERVIRVSNTGQLGPAAAGRAAGWPGTGTGLANVRQRLELAFPGRHAFALTERGGWVHAEIRLREEAKA